MRLAQAALIEASRFERVGAGKVAKFLMDCAGKDAGAPSRCPALYKTPREGMIGKAGAVELPRKREYAGQI